MRLWFHSLMVTILTFLVIGGIYRFLQLNILEAFDPISKAVEQIDLADIAFSRLREGEPEPDGNITIVNVGELSKEKIARQIRNIAAFNPRVIGFSDVFDCRKYDPVNCPSPFDSIGTAELSQAIVSAEKSGIQMVMGEVLLETGKLQNDELDLIQYDSISHSIPEILNHAEEGFVNLMNDSDSDSNIRYCREIIPSIRVNGHTEYAFSVKLALAFDSMKAALFLARGNETETINFRGNIPDYYDASGYSGRYQFLDSEQALDTSQFSGNMIRDKIVIFGYHGKDLYDQSLRGKYYTPLNNVYAGRANPDMYETVIHANAASMILNEDYIGTMNFWQSLLAAFTIVLLTSALFFKLEEKSPTWFDMLSLLVQFSLVILLSFSMILTFSYYSIKLEFNLALAAVALVGTCFEIYKGGVLTAVGRFRNRYCKPAS